MDLQNEEWRMMARQKSYSQISLHLLLFLNKYDIYQSVFFIRAEQKTSKTVNNPSLSMAAACSQGLDVCLMGLARRMSGGCSRTVKQCRSFPGSFYLCKSTNLHLFIRFSSSVKSPRR